MRAWAAARCAAVMADSGGSGRRSPPGWPKPWGADSGMEDLLGWTEGAAGQPGAAGQERERADLERQAQGPGLQSWPLEQKRGQHRAGDLAQREGGGDLSDPARGLL